MDWLPLLLPLAAGLFALAVALRRRLELRQHGDSLAARAAAKAQGSHRARLQHPRIDLAACIGCGACVRACPEDGVLGLAFGQAVVVHGARCVGHGLCAAACPTNAIALTLGDLQDRKDLPAIDRAHEAVGVPGLFLAGEITGFALVRTAVAHGALVARTVAARTAGRPTDANATPAAAAIATPKAAAGATVAAAPHGTGAADGGAVLDLLVVGLGPAGLACLLEARAHGLRTLGVDQAAELGGTVAAYPRKKLVMTQPIDLPGHGRLARLEYTKEELVDLWRDLARRHALPVRTGVTVQRIERDPAGGFVVATDQGPLRARHVCLAVGRRGTPQRLGVPGEDLPKVAYSLLDAEGYRDRRILVVGGGDSAIEAALALAEQPGNTVALAYRRSAFSRLKARNEQRIQRAIADGTVQVLFETTVAAITAHAVVLRSTGVAAPRGAAATTARDHAAPTGRNGGAAAATGREHAAPQTRHGGERSGAAPGERGERGGGGGDEATALLELPNDDVFVFAGGTPPFPLLEAAGVSFDPALRPADAPAADRGTAVLVALLGAVLGLAGLAALRWWHAAYYDLPVAARIGSPWHDALRPQGALGLAAGAAALLLFTANLLYLLRRRPRLGRVLPGSLKAWMNVHVVTGLFAGLLAIAHSGFAVRDSSGGHALLAMLVVVVAGVIGRWLYAFVPRAQNGRQQDLEELTTRVAAIAGEWDEHGRGFGGDVRAQVEQLAADARLGRGFAARVLGLVRSQRRLRAAIAQLRTSAAAAGVPATELAQLVDLARRSHRVALQLAHFDEVRGVLATWRWLHRWLALLLLLLLVVHVVTALRYGGVDFAVLLGGGAR